MRTGLGRHPPTSYVCNYCGKLFKSYYKNRKFCSRACTGKGKSLKTQVGGRVDNNQKEIVSALEAVGATVLVAGKVCKGFPDLIVGYRGVNYLLEIKNPATWYGRRGLNPNQIDWHAGWKGPIAIVTCVQQALTVIGALR